MRHRWILTLELWSSQIYTELKSSFYLEDTFHLIICRQYSSHDSSALLGVNISETLCFPPQNKTMNSLHSRDSTELKPKIWDINPYSNTFLRKVCSNHRWRKPVLLQVFAFLFSAYMNSKTSFMKFLRSGISFIQLLTVPKRTGLQQGLRPRWQYKNNSLAISRDDKFVPLLACY